MLGLMNLLLLGSSVLLIGKAHAAPQLQPPGGVTMCGGAEWTGPTTCPAGYVCTKLNDYVSLCVRELSTTEIATTRPGGPVTPTIPVPPGPTGLPPPFPPIPIPNVE